MKNFLIFGGLTLALLASIGMVAWKTLHAPEPVKDTSVIVDEPGTVSLKVGEEKREGGMIITLKEVSNDSRCPVDVQCIAAGNVQLRLSVRVGEMSEEITYASDAEPYYLEGYALSVLSVTPDAHSNDVLTQPDYRVKFKIEEKEREVKHPPQFSEYPVEATASETEATLDLTSHKEVEKYETDIKKGFAKGVNFAGHYAVATVKFDEDRTMSTIIDTETGKVIVSGILSKYGLSFVATSSLLIVNPPWNIPEADLALLRTENATETNFMIGSIPTVSDYYSIQNTGLSFISKFDVRTGEERTCEPSPANARNDFGGTEATFSSLCAVPFGYEVLAPKEAEEFKKGDETWRKYKNADLGIAFEYRIDPNGYTLTEREPETQSGGTLARSVVLTNTKEYEEFAKSTEPREAPPSITILVYEDSNVTDAAVWVEGNKGLSNYNPEKASLTPILVGEQSGVLYNATGLYPSSNVVVVQNGKIYHILGTYRERTDAIYSDFDVVVATAKLY